MMVSEQATRVTSTVDYTPEGRYLVKGGSSFLQQYASFYFGRLNQLRDAATASARKRWGEDTKGILYADRIVDIREPVGDVDTVVCGIVFRDTSSKPSILAEYADTGGDTGVLIPPPPKLSDKPYVGGKVVIEDENGRCILDVSKLDTSIRALTTGLVVAVRGRENADMGTFCVSDIALCGCAPQNKMPKLDTDKFVCFLSAPAMNGIKTDGKLEMFLEFLKGTITEENSDESMAISQLVITGPLLSGSGSGVDDDVSSLAQSGPLENGSANGSANNSNGNSNNVSPLTELDRFLTVAASLCPTVIVPGSNDPVNTLMPQQPIHRCLLPSSSRGANLHRAPNPTAARIDDRFIVGTAGQPVRDMQLYGTIESALADENGDSIVKTEKGRGEATSDGANKKKKEEDIDVDMDVDMDTGMKIKAEEMEKKERMIAEKRKGANEILDVLQTMLESRHIAPTAPDTLGAYPFQNKDPFVLEESPHILFAGNQNTFATRMYGTPDGGGVYNYDTKNVLCRLLALPRFCETGRIVLVNLNTLHCTLREFSGTLEIKND